MMISLWNINVEQARHIYSIQQIMVLRPCLDFSMPFNWSHKFVDDEILKSFFSIPNFDVRHVLFSLKIFSLSLLVDLFFSRRTYISNTIDNAILIVVLPGIHPSNRSLVSSIFPLQYFSLFSLQIFFLLLHFTLILCT